MQLEIRVCCVRLFLQKRLRVLAAYNPDVEQPQNWLLLQSMNFANSPFSKKLLGTKCVLCCAVLMPVAIPISDSHEFRNAAREAERIANTNKPRERNLKSAITKSTASNAKRPDMFDSRQHFPM